MFATPLKPLFCLESAINGLGTPSRQVFYLESAIKTKSFANLCLATCVEGHDAVRGDQNGFGNLLRPLFCSESAISGFGTPLRQLFCPESTIKTKSIAKISA